MLNITQFNVRTVPTLSDHSEKSQCHAVIVTRQTSARMLAIALEE